jgi:DNA-binding transcriptional MocR family regulator
MDSFLIMRSSSILVQVQIRRFWTSTVSTVQSKEPVQSEPASDIVLTMPARTSKSAPSDSPLYVQIAETLVQQVARGALRSGDRVPSLRQLSRQQHVSVSTALQAYLWLENRGYLEARPQSGFYVRTPFAKLIPEPRFEAMPGKPTALGNNAVTAGIIAAAADPANVAFGAGCVSPELFPNRKLNLILRQIIRERPLHSATYDFPPGLERLRHQIARRALAAGCRVSPRDVIITSGAQDAITLSLRAEARPGDVIAVESPTFFGILESAASLKMKVLEISTHPQGGMDLHELEQAIKKHSVKACVIMPNCHNPLGYVLPDSYKQALVELTARKNVAVIENDLYGDLAFDDPRPVTAQSFDRKGLVLLCSSFSKVLSPGYRIGWVFAGRFQAEVERLKVITSIAAPSLPQLVVAEFLSSGGYDRHVKRLRATVAAQVEEIRQAAFQSLPEGTRITRPAGGHALWIELPAKIEAMKLWRAALDERISSLPGSIFSPSRRYRNHIRLNAGIVPSDARSRTLATLGRLCDRLMRN